MWQTSSTYTAVKRVTVVHSQLSPPPPRPEIMWITRPIGSLQGGEGVLGSQPLCSKPFNHSSSVASSYHPFQDLLTMPQRKEIVPQLCPSGRTRGRLYLPGTIAFLIDARCFLCHVSGPVMSLSIFMHHQFLVFSWER